MGFRYPGTLEASTFGAAAIILVLGDIFHLMPRMVRLCGSSSEKLGTALGYGKMISSITMTVFYVCICSTLRINSLTLWVIISTLAIIRILACLLPQNHWKAETGSVMPIVRNIPFIIMGAIICACFFIAGERNAAFTRIAIYIILSFAFYLPVVFGAKKHTALGTLMLPKSVMYILIVAEGVLL
jgi:hypothetical protein